MHTTNTAYPDVPWPPRESDENCRKIPAEEIDRYRGQQVAYSWDGSGIVAGATTREELFQKLANAGFNRERVVFDYIWDL